MESVTFDSEESRSDHIPDNAVVERVRYNGGSETVEYVTPDEYTEDELRELGRSELYSIGEQLGVDLTWSGEEADNKEQMITKIVEEVEEE